MSEARFDRVSNENNTAGPTISGITTFSGQNFFVPPKGNTAQRPSDCPPGSIRFNTDSAHLEYFDGLQWLEMEAFNNEIGQAGALGNRGLYMGGFAPGPITYNTIDYITISTLGNAIDFGDFIDATRYGAACSSSTRGLYGGGFQPGQTANIYFVTISSTGNSSTFGNLTQSRLAPSSGSNSTRGIFSGGYTPTNFNIIDYVTIASTGNAQDFGDLTTTRSQQLGTVCSSTRCVQGGAELGATDSNILDYITIASTGNATDFGDLTNGGDSAGSNGGCSNSTRGLFAYCRIGPTSVNNIDYITISSIGNATDFGDVSIVGEHCAVSSTIRGVFAASNPSGNDITYSTIATTGNTADFGELTLARTQMSGVSNGHGGL
jgi:hypothetical protein